MEKNFEWVKQVIGSCTNNFQLHCCNVLCDRFKELYEANDLYQQLLQAMIDQGAKWEINA